MSTYTELLKLKWISHKRIVTKGETGRDKSGAWDEHIHTTVYEVDNKQGPTV